jgi:hypothetical protein
MLKNLERDRLLRNGSSLGEKDGAAVSGFTIDANYLEKSPKKHALSDVARLRHLIPKNYRSKKGFTLPFIYDRLNTNKCG